MDGAAPRVEQKPATAARIYDYFLGGVHNFPADQQAARQVIEQFPFVPGGAQANRRFLRRAVRYLTGAGIRQFLDIGSGIPTEGNVHEVAQREAPDARVVYVDIDPVAVAESQDLLVGNACATAVRGDLADPDAVLAHPGVRGLLDLDQPVALLLAAVLHFMPDDSQATGVIERLLGAVPAGSFLLVSHAAAESFPPASGDHSVVQDLYRRQTSTPAALRTREEVEGFFTGAPLVAPGVAWLPEWRPDPDQPDPLAGQPELSCGWAGVGRKE